MTDCTLRLGEKVACSAYIKKSGNHYETYAGVEGCDFWAKGATEGEEVEGYHTCDRFETILRPFCGVYVGTTQLCTALVAEYEDPPYGASGYRFRHSEPKQFAVVYYANNRKRLVPMDAIRPIGG